MSSATDTAAIRLEGVGKRYLRSPDRRASMTERIVRGRARRSEEFWALRHLDLHIPAGSLYGVIGHNGSGKSTMLKLIGRISRPTEGRVSVSGRVAALIELGAGFHPDLTGRENIRLNGAVLGLSRREVERAMDSIIDFSDLGEVIDEPVKHYSSGMYVRLGFSVAAHVDPDILLIDEVLAVGDEDFQRKCLDHLFALRRSGRTIVVVSHGLGLLESLCDEIAWLDHGQLRRLGPPADVIGAYIEQVNVKNAAREQPASATRQPDSYRTGAATRATTLDLVAPDGAVASHLVTGGRATFRLGIDSDIAVDDLVVRIVVQHEAGSVVGVLDSRLDDAVLGTFDGRCTVEVDLDDIALLPGHFRIHVELCDRAGARVVDTWVDALGLAVRSTDGELAQGLVRFPGRFRRV